MFGEPTVQEETAKKKIISVLTALAVTVSVTVVLALITIKLAQPQDAEVIARVIKKTEVVQPKMEKKSVQKMVKQASSASASSMSTKMIQANTSAVISMPKVNVVNQGVLGLGEGEFGDGFGSGSGSGAGQGGVGSMKGVGRSVGGMRVQASRLGVVLDVSGSMTPFLEDLRKEIKKEFKDAVFREVTGCSLSVYGGDLSGLDPDVEKRSSVVQAMRELAEVEKVDAIFWFSDLNDGRAEEALEELKVSFWHGKPPVKKEKSKFGGLDALEKLQDRSQKMGERPREPCRLYIRSTGQQPDKELLRLVKDSGGSFKKA